MTPLAKLLKRREEQDPELDDWTEMCKGTIPVDEVQWRSRAKVAGRVRSLRYRRRRILRTRRVE